MTLQFLTRALGSTLAAITLLAAATAFAQTAPTQPPAGQAHAPRPEQIAACTGKTEGTACTVQTPRGTHEGTCQTKGSTVLACHGEHHGGQAPFGAPPQP